jgi:hypothetical protein
LQRFAQIIRALTQFVEQARVLDGDDCLRGKVLDQLDLLVREWAHFLTVNNNGADHLVVLQHGDADQGARTGEVDAGLAQLIP